MNLAVEIERRKAKDREDENRIFTCIANETRLNSLSIIKKHKQDSQSVISAGAKAKYLAELESGNEMIREIESILQKAMPGKDQFNLLVSHL
jgi:hypothetical protein